MDSAVLEKMIPYFTEKFGNAASRNHGFGWDANQAVDTARKQVADVIGAMMMTEQAQDVEFVTS